MSLILNNDHSVLGGLLINSKYYKMFKKKKYKSETSLAGKNDVVNVSIRGNAFKALVASEVERYRFNEAESKEPETLDWIDEYVSEGDVFFDVGANIGIFTLYGATKVGDTGRVYSFEPESANFTSLIRNIATNGLQDRVIASPLAVSGELGVDWFNLSSRDFFSGQERKGDDITDNFVSGSALHTFGRDSAECSGFFRHACLGVNLDWIVQQPIFAVPNHIKIDVDGIEMMILKGADSLLENAELKTILVEIISDSGAKEFLLKKGFESVLIGGNSGNNLFVRK